MPGKGERDKGVNILGKLNHMQTDTWKKSLPCMDTDKMTKVREAKGGVCLLW